MKFVYLMIFITGICVYHQFLTAEPNQDWTISTEEKLSSEKSDKAKSPHTFKSTLTFVTDYRSRGISQTMRRPAVQGELFYKHKSGFYFKTWASNVDGTGNYINNTSLEWDFFLGLAKKYFQTPFEIDAGVEFYYYPGGESRNPQHTSYNTIEYYAQFSYKKFSITFHQTITDYFGVKSENPPINWNTRRPLKPNGHSIGSPYLEANWEISINPKCTVTLHAGYQAIINYSKLNYADWTATLAYKFEWFDAIFSYVATTARHAFYDVPDHSCHGQRRRLGASGVYVGVIRAF